MQFGTERTQPTPLRPCLVRSKSTNVCQMKRIGQDIAERLDYEPGVFSVERHVRGKWACAHCRKLVQAPVPAHVIDKAWCVLHTGQVSLAQGGFFAIGAYASGMLTAMAGWPLWLALPAASLISAAVAIAVGFPALRVKGLAVLIGLYVERLCFGAIGDQEGHEGRASAVRQGTGFDGREVVALASSFALWMQLEQLAVNLPPRHLNAFPDLSLGTEWSALGLFLRPERLAVALLAIALTAALAWWLQHTRGGLAWRAAASQRTAASLSGIAVARVQALAFLAACALSGVAAFAVLSLDGQVTPMFGMWMLTKGLVAAMLGGLGSVRGALWGGWLLGVVEAHAQVAFGAVGREFATYALLFAVLALGLHA